MKREEMVRFKLKVSRMEDESMKVEGELDKRVLMIVERDRWSRVDKIF